AFTPVPTRGSSDLSASVAGVRSLVVVIRAVNQTSAPDPPPLSSMWTHVDTHPRTSVACRDLHAHAGDLYGHGRQVGDHQVGGEFAGLVGCGQGHGPHAGGAAGAQPGGGVLEDDAVPRVH